MQNVALILCFAEAWRFSLEVTSLAAAQVGFVKVPAVSKLFVGLYEISWWFWSTFLGTGQLTMVGPIFGMQEVCHELERWSWMSWRLRCLLAPPAGRGWGILLKGWHADVNRHGKFASSAVADFTVSCKQERAVCSPCLVLHYTAWDRRIQNSF